MKNEGFLQSFTWILQSRNENSGFGFKKMCVNVCTDTVINSRKNRRSLYLKLGSLKVFLIPKTGQPTDVAHLLQVHGL
jgi:hypothetical protein